MDIHGSQWTQKWIFHELGRPENLAGNVAADRGNRRIQGELANNVNADPGTFGRAEAP